MSFDYSIKSPLRYPGGKTRALKYILPLIPEFDEYREPFVGGGSVYFSVKQTFKDKKYWINDLNRDLYLFWKLSQNKLDKLVKEITKIWIERNNGRKLYNYYNDRNKDFDDFERAVRFFILNRITFSGTVDSGGYSKESFENRFTKSSIDRLSKIQPLLEKIKITNFDYEELLFQNGNNVFIFLDPPYFSATTWNLYGKSGEFNVNFDHERFAKQMRKCQHKWLITYDNSEKIKELFSFANIKEWSFQYGMNNVGDGRPDKGEELFISNYSLESVVHHLQQKTI